MEGRGKQLYEDPRQCPLVLLLEVMYIIGRATI
jgi:hypothetical protein